MTRILGFGEVLLRLASPAGVPMAHGATLDIHVGGAEANVLGALAQLGHDAAMLSVLPDTMLGDRAANGLRLMGIDTAPIRRGPGRMGLYWLEPGAGPRPGRIVYDRAGSAFAEAAGDVDWTDALAGADWLHLSGITPALTGACARATLAVARAARAAGVRVSLDCNYRPSLWAASGGDAPGLLAALAGEAELLFGNHRDIALMTGEGFADEDRDRQATLAAFRRFPSLRLIASTRREVESAAQQSLSARLDMRDGAFVSDAVAMTGIIDRIGAGDAFAAGVLHGVLSGEKPARMVELGLAAAVQKHFIAGDMWIGGIGDLNAEAGDISR